MATAKEQQTLLQTTIKLPDNFRSADVMAIYLRDSQAIAERVFDQTIEKGLVWEGHPACLTIHFQKTQLKASLLIDGVVKHDNKLFVSMLRRMLGLTQEIELFEQQHLQHPDIGVLINHNAGLRVPTTATIFEAVVWAVTGQQISVRAAIAIRRRIIQLAAIQHSRGLLCHPDAYVISTLSEDALTEAGLSKTKAKTIRLLSHLIVNGEIPLEQWQINTQISVGEINNKLLAISGIGPWTVNYTLLRGFGWLDGSLHGDVAVRRNLQKLLNKPDKLSAEFTEQWLMQFQPWRALVAAHLWKMDSTIGY